MAQQYNSIFKFQMVLVALAVSLVLVNLISQEANAFSLGPLVNVGASKLFPDGRHVSVNVPAIFKMNLDTRGQHKGLKMDQSVLSGLVKISMDRTLGSDGNNTGPIKVSVGGMTMFDNSQTA